MQTLPIVDHVIWFKHVPERTLLDRLAELPAEAEIMVEVDGVTGRWRRMKRGRDGRLPDAIVPIGPMKSVWNDWYRTRRGEMVAMRLVVTADDYLEASGNLFSEWGSPEDEEAFRDL